MNEQLIPKEIISDGIGQIYYLLPIPFIVLVLVMSIWLGFTNLNGETVKGYKVYNVLTALGLAVLAHFTISVYDRVVKDIPTLIIRIVFLVLFIDIFIFWRKKTN